jgi:hypothetical protein
MSYFSRVPGGVYATVMKEHRALDEVVKLLVKRFVALDRFLLNSLFDINSK